MTEGKFLPPLPPHGLRRPSLLAVGPFHESSSSSESIRSFMPIFDQLKSIIPCISFFIVGNGANHCFSKGCPSQVFLLEFSGLPKEYIFYSNILMDFGGDDPLQLAALEYARAIKADLQSHYATTFFSAFTRLLGIGPPRLEAQHISDLIRSNSASLSIRFDKTMDRKSKETREKSSLP